MDKSFDKVDKIYVWGNARIVQENSSWFTFCPRMLTKNIYEKNPWNVDSETVISKSFEL